jgi:hypothetical protein
LLGIAQLDAASLGGGERELGALRNHPPLLLGDGRAPLPRSARKPATAAAKRLMPTQMSARCFALALSPRPEPGRGSCLLGTGRAAL